MKFKHVNLIISLVVAALVFTFVTYLVLNSTDLLIGTAFFFVLLLAIMGFLLKRMIEQMYDLLVSPPTPGKIIDPFKIIAFDRVLWQYPKEGSFTFMDVKNDQISVFEPPLQSNEENHVEVKTRTLPLQKTRPGPKPSYSEEEQFQIAKEYLDSQKPGGTKETYASIAAKYNVSSERFKDFLQKYREAVQTGRILE